MFIGVGQIANDAQQWGQHRVLAIEWLKLSQDIGIGGTQPLEGPIESFGEFVRVIDDDERQSLFIAGRRVDVRHLAKGVHQVIQSGTQIIEAISDDDRPPDEIRRGASSQDRNPYPGLLRATLDKGLITATVEPRLDFTVNSLEVFFSAV